MHKPTTWRKSRIPEQREIANAFIPIHCQYLTMPITLKWKVQAKKISRISLKIVVQCCAPSGRIHVYMYVFNCMHVQFMPLGIPFSRKCLAVQSLISAPFYKNFGWLSLFSDSDLTAFPPPLPFQFHKIQYTQSHPFSYFLKTDVLSYRCCTLC